MNNTIEDLDFAHPNGREVPVRIFPASSTEKGWILFSVGFGGTRSGYGYLARAWAESGYHTAVVEHVGSNLDVLKSLPQKRTQERNAEVVRRVQDSAELLARPQDLHLVHGALSERFAHLPLGLAGHSYGSYTALAAAGLEPKSIRHGLLGIPNSSILAISPQPPDMLFESSEFGEMASPTLLLTGTEDHILSGEASYEDRKRVFPLLPPDLRALLVLRGAEHMTFAGIGLNLAPQLEAIKHLTLLWWEHSFIEGATDWCQVVQSSQQSEMIFECQ